VSKILKASAVAASAALAVPLWAVPAAWAASASEPASIGAYFYAPGIDKPEQAPAAPPNVTGAATDGVAPEHLGVGARANQTDKMSFLFFDLATVPLDATISKATVTVPLAEPSPPLTDPRQANVQRNPAPEKVRVCAAGPEGFNGEDGQSFASAPTMDCESFTAPAVATADKKAYTFDITALASTWLVDANNGLALVPAEGAGDFQVVFLPMDQSKITAEFTAAAVEEFPADFGTDVSVTPDLGSGFTGDSGPVDSGFSGGGDIPVDDGGFGSVEAPSIDTALPETEGAAEVAPEPDVAGATQVRNVAAAGDVPLTPTPVFWLGLLALAGMLGLMSLIMGDSRIPAQAAGSQTRLSRALQDRQGAGGPARVGRPITI